LTQQRRLRGALIGFGNVAASGHLPGWRDCAGAELVAATDAEALRRGVFLAACPDGQWFASIEELLAAGGLDFVDICTPPASHAPNIRQALAAGLHVLCEKPLAIRAADAIAAAGERRGRVLHTVHNWLEAPISRQISRLIAKGAIGAVRSIDWQTLRMQPAVSVAAKGAENWRTDPAIAGGGILFDHGWHALYCVLRWVGGAPLSIAAALETRRFHEWPLEDTATLDLIFPAGNARIFLTWTAMTRANHIGIEGESGRIRIEGDSVILVSADGEHRWACPPALSEGSHHPDWFGAVAADFCAAVVQGTSGNLDEALLCARLIELAQQSNAAGGMSLAV
jgi:predicted dehydrogenase